MFDGFYQARFETPDGNDLGVITLAEGKKLYGGNNEFLYLGTYERKGDNFIADVEVKPLFVQFSGRARKYVRKIKMIGRGGFQNIMCVCESSDSPGVKIKAVLERVII
ncbi:MAG: hypothetical protein KF794_11530 [Xanthobacteraceae bacterium]|nr:hypothetical protein [Xanthobacteraceae bacterium]QYK44400.1 MAG: hypothetical protein KF794_11530 [Xanthobacteraceae bacterium]